MKKNPIYVRTSIEKPVLPTHNANELSKEPKMYAEANNLLGRLTKRVGKILLEILDTPETSLFIALSSLHFTAVQHGLGGQEPDIYLFTRAEFEDDNLSGWRSLIISAKLHAPSIGEYKSPDVDARVTFKGGSNEPDATR